MRLPSTCFLLLPVALLLANSNGSVESKIEVHTINGPVEIIGVDGQPGIGDSDSQDIGGPKILHVGRNAALDITTSNGAISVTGVSGPMRLTTSNASITVRDSQPSAVYAHTSNGRIEVSLPASLNATLSAQTSNGQIHSDLPVNATRSGPTFLVGTTGSGGTRIDLYTSNGSILLTLAGDREAVNSTFKPGPVQ